MPPSMTTARDIPILITSTASSSERRITPSWSIAHLKTKLEPVTGVPPSSQILALRLPDRQEETAIEAEDEESVEIGSWPLVPYAEIKVWSSFFLFFGGVCVCVCVCVHVFTIRPNQSLSIIGVHRGKDAD